jgi:hypothetical protein
MVAVRLARPAGGAISRSARFQLWVRNSRSRRVCPGTTTTVPTRCAAHRAQRTAGAGECHRRSRQGQWAQRPQANRPNRPCAGVAWVRPAEPDRLAGDPRAGYRCGQLGAGPPWATSTTTRRSPHDHGVPVWLQTSCRPRRAAAAAGQPQGSPSRRTARFATLRASVIAASGAQDREVSGQHRPSRFQHDTEATPVIGFASRGIERQGGHAARAPPGARA